MKLTVKQNLKLLSTKIKIYQEYLETQTNIIKSLEADRHNVSLRIFQGMSINMTYDLVETENGVIDMIIRDTGNITENIMSQIRLYETMITALKVQENQK